MDFQITPIQNPNIPEPVQTAPVLGGKSGNKMKYILMGVILVFIVAGVLVYFNRNHFSEKNVVLSLDGPQEISAGQLVEYKIGYKNTNKLDLSRVKLSFLFPSDAVIVKDDGTISDTINQTLDLPDLKAGDSGEKTFTAYIVGDKGNIKTSRATLTYVPKSMNSEFKTDISLATTITSLDVPITLVAAPTVINGQSLSYIVDYRNQSAADLADLRFIVKYPQGFNRTSVVPVQTSTGPNQDTWDVPSLKQGSGARLTIQGIINGSQGDTKTVSVELQKKIAGPNGSVFVDFEKTEASSVISMPLLSVSYTLNDSSDYTAHLGDTLNYVVNFKNSTLSDITGLELTAKLEGNMYDFSSVNTQGYFDSRTGIVTWSSSNVPTLNSLPANSSGTVQFQVRLKSTFSGASGAKNSFVKASAHIETPNVPSGLELDKLSADTQISTRISAAPALSQKIFLKDSVLGASGPFPPVVDKKTVFTARWNLINPSNDVSGAKVTAVLAPGVKWENNIRVSGTQVQPVYNSRQNTVTWDIGTLSGGVGVSFPQYEADFQISITPSSNQAGQYPPLLKNVRFDGVDTFTKEQISRTIMDTSTMNVNDTNESGAVLQK